MACVHAPVLALPHRRGASTVGKPRPGSACVCERGGGQIKLLPVTPMRRAASAQRGSWQPGCGGTHNMLKTSEDVRGANTARVPDHMHIWYAASRFAASRPSITPAWGTLELTYGTHTAATYGTVLSMHTEGSLRAYCARAAGISGGLPYTHVLRRQGQTSQGTGCVNGRAAAATDGRNAAAVTCTPLQALPDAPRQHA